MRQSPVVPVPSRSFLLAFFSVVASSPNLSTCLLKSFAKVRISERFTKFAIKREQKKFTFYAEREQIRPLCQIYLRKSEPTNETRAEYACMLCLVRRRKTTGQREYLRPAGQCYE